MWRHWGMGIPPDVRKVRHGMTSRDDQAQANEIEAAALAWLVRVQSDAATGEDWAALTVWLEASEDHLAAYEAVESLSLEIEAQAADIARGLATETNVVPLKTRPRPGGWWTSTQGLSAIAAGLVLAVSPLLWGAYQGQPVTYSAEPGPGREITLSDGSQIHLNGASALTVRLGWTRRRVEMADAEASFDVAKDPDRPFIITVADQQVRVVGTRFNIRNRDDAVVVTVQRGIVEVRQPALGSQPIARLEHGDELRHRVGRPGSTRVRVDPAEAFSWTEGRLVCNDRPLSDLVAELNRRYATPIRLSPRAAGRTFSGVLTLADQDQLVSRLAAYLSLKVRRTGGEIILD